MAALYLVLAYSVSNWHTMGSAYSLLNLLWQKRSSQSICILTWYILSRAVFNFKVKVILALILRHKAKFILSEMPIKFVLLWISIFSSVGFQPKAIASESLFRDVLYVFAEMFPSLNNAKQLLYTYSTIPLKRRPCDFEISMDN